MKTHNLFFLSLFIIAVCCFSCENTEATGGNETQTPPDDDMEEPDYPIEISFTEYTYSLYRGCSWKFPNPHEVAIINSYGELANYLSCPNDSFPEVDLSTHSLLYVCGVSSNGLYNISKELLQTSRNNYKLNVGMHILDTTDIGQKWISVLITDKLDEKSNIELNITTYPNEAEYSIWEYTGPYDSMPYDSSLVIKMSFYPSIHKVHIRRNFETTGASHLMQRYGVQDYCIIDGNKMYLKSPESSDYNFSNYNSWIIESLSENEMWLYYGGIVLEPPFYHKSYRFICQTKFKEI